MKCLSILSWHEIIPKGVIISYKNEKSYISVKEWWYHTKMKPLHFGDLYKCETFDYMSQSSVQYDIWD